MGLQFESGFLTEFGFKLNGNNDPMPEEPYTFLDEHGRLALGELWRSRQVQTNDETLDIPTALLDALSPIHDAVKTYPLWRFGGVRNRAPSLPIELHPTVRLREDALWWAKAQHRDPEVRDHVKKLKLTTYGPKLAQNSRDVEIEEEEHNALVAQFRASSLGSSVLGETGA